MMRSGPIVLMISLCFFLVRASRMEQMIAARIPQERPVPPGMIRCKPTACCYAPKFRCCEGGDWCCIGNFHMKVIASWC
ncbi:unnamed protein product [Nezara viridula]|uniref:Neuropeptide n=1 Tax=Nezara viridula TaxID=85310 RepID=A0A9P0HF63_NEZVI|nr:unnamed protein product [Nezara viridula]